MFSAFFFFPAKTMYKKETLSMKKMLAFDLDDSHVEIILVHRFISMSAFCGCSLWLMSSPPLSFCFFE